MKKSDMYSTHSCSVSLCKLLQHVCLSGLCFTSECIYIMSTCLTISVTHMSVCTVVVLKIIMLFGLFDREIWQSEYSNHALEVGSSTRVN